MTVDAVIRFGTDGWRGVIAEDFTYENVRKVATAIARYVVRCERAERRLGRGGMRRMGLAKARIKLRRGETLPIPVDLPVPYQLEWDLVDVERLFQRSRDTRCAVGDHGDFGHCPSFVT